MEGSREASAAVAADYAARGAAFAENEAGLRRRAERISQVRLVAFIVAAASGILLAAGRLPAVLLTAGVMAGVIGYLVAANRHGIARRLADWSGVRRAVCEQGMLRVRRDWNALAASTDELAAPEHPYASDLDVTGHASLVRLLDVTSPGPGRRTLRSWLEETVPPASEIRARQEAVRELAPAVEWRETLTAHAWMTGRSRPSDVERFFAWAEEKPWLHERPWMLWAARLLPFAIVPTVTLAFLSLFWGLGVVPPPPEWAAALALAARRWWALPLGAGIMLSLVARREVPKRLEAALSHLGGLAAYAAMLGHVESGRFRAARLTRLATRLSAGGSASRAVTRLGAIMRRAEVRYSPMGHTVLQLLGLWDFHVLAALERWQAASGAHARDWLAALGEAEALSALGTLAHDNPGWVMPELVDGDARIEARELGHPLLPPGTRVNNDVTVGSAGTFLLITGSNMSGKSTLLRAIGTNVVLAQAGGPVCAESMRLSPVDIWTSIRIDDSLEAGVSLFMAELKRLKRIVDAARDPARIRPLLYLLDEILHGTNTAERRVAARRVVTYLLEAAAIGAVTTHDLTLADDPTLERAAERVHFTEQFVENNGVTTMTFDYRLRPGLATSANALKLLAMIGLGDDPA